MICIATVVLALSAYIGTNSTRLNLLRLMGYGTTRSAQACRSTGVLQAKSLPVMLQLSLSLSSSLVTVLPYSCSYSPTPTLPPISSGSWERGWMVLLSCSWRSSLRFELLKPLQKVRHRTSQAGQRQCTREAVCAVRTSSKTLPRRGGLEISRAFRVLGVVRSAGAAAALF
jgi:hypothetical protein